jgi:hypothetical protein
MRYTLSKSTMTTTAQFPSSRAVPCFFSLAALILSSCGPIVREGNKPVSTRPSLPSPEEIARLPADGGPSYNRLVHEKSPYLLQHAANPVDWYPWGPEAFDRARRENKPVFLSVGYSSCHWCHVMEHESFERDDVAEILNRDFICIKVDREERPDLDDIYMTATQIMSGRGGWPNSVWLTADKRPWYAGTYFPREDAPGRPGFKTLLRKLAEIWQTRRADVETQAEQLSSALREHARVTAGSATPDIVDMGQVLEQALAAYRESYDLQHGGFGGAPKFPPHSALLLLLQLERTAPRPAIRNMLTGTLDAMRRGGIHDHVGGGFHRYSTDERWFLPHFEKMLYDNALLARAYTEAWELTQDESFRRAARDTLDWALRDMRGSEGGFFSALDADSEGEEGKFYVWSHDEIIAVLGPAEGARFARTFGILPGGNFHDEATGKPTGLNIPHLSDASDRKRVASLLARLREVRAKRVWPGLDDKVLTAWNGLMIGSLARAGKSFSEPRYTRAAERAARFILADMRKAGVLLRSYREGAARGAAYLEDYAALANALIDLNEATGDAAWLSEATAIADRMLARFWDNEHGGFFFTADDHEALLIRSKDALDQAMPSGNGLAAQALARLAVLANRPDYEKKARQSIATFAPLLRRLPTAGASLLHAAALLEAQTRQPVQLPSEHVVTATLTADRRLVRPDDELNVAIELTIAPGWHIQAHEPSQPRLTPTTVEVLGTDFALTDVKYPRGRVTAAGGFDQLRVYEGNVTLTAALRASKTLSGFATARFRLRWQACDDASCQAPESAEQELTMRVEM